MANTPIMNIIIENGFVYCWLLLALTFLLLELSVPGLFFFIAFSGGCIAAAIFTWLGYGLVTQCVVALVASLISFVILKWKCASIIRNGSDVKTNIDALSGQEAIVLQDISHLNKGQVRVRGESWPAKIDAKKGSIKKGEVVRIIRIEGNSVIVTGHTSTGG
jgi:membrane protein implicated in regulation of membrane protease activity